VEFEAARVHLVAAELLGPVFIEAGAAVVAEAGAEMVFLRAPSASVGELSRRHREEEPAGAIDEFDVTDNKGLIERERAERLETTLAHVAQIDANLRQLHVHTPGRKRPT
jgi:hypothetical protein